MRAEVKNNGYASLVFNNPCSGMDYVLSNKCVSKLSFSWLAAGWFLTTIPLCVDRWRAGSIVTNACPARWYSLDYLKEMTGAEFILSHGTEYPLVVTTCGGFV